MCSRGLWASFDHALFPFTTFFSYMILTDSVYLADQYIRLNKLLSVSSIEGDMVG